MTGSDDPREPLPAVVRWARDRADLRAAQDLRVRVFCDEQGVERELELDGRDELARHGIAVDDDGRVVGTIRLLTADGGRVVRVGRLAVERDLRGRGIARELLRRAERYARDIGAHELRLAAQVDAMRLYLAAGYEAQGEPFDEAGITHVWMVRDVPPSPRPRRPSAADPG
ncbi:MAG: GNAT family N-acetyltransferase [Solirubrobacteraceae bacterium]|nr:GNAT family N-acetyltransferase [Solirubrobacteraceae bacterium]